VRIVDDLDAAAEALRAGHRAGRGRLKVQGGEPVEWPLKGTASCSRSASPAASTTA
jgi:hypothetical protein